MTVGRKDVHHGLVVLVLALALWRGVVALAGLAQHWPGVTGAVGGWRWAVLGTAILAFVGAAAALGLRLRMWRDGRWQDMSVAPFRVLLYCAVGGWLAYLVLFDGYVPLAFVWLSAVALGLWALLLLAAPVLVQVLPAPAVRAADLAAFYLLVLVVGGEVGLRTLAQVRPSVLLARPNDLGQAQVAAGRYPPGTVRYGFPVNSTGHYDEEFVPKRPGERLVVTIGDSFSAGVVPHFFHFTTVAERRLEGAVTIDNMGVPAIDPPGYLYLFLHEALPLHPDAVVVDLYLGNDVSYPLPPAEDVVARAWLDRQNILLLQVPRRLAKLAREGEGVRHGLAGEGGGDTGDVFDGRAEALRRLPWLADPLLEHETFNERSYLEVERTRFERLAELDREGIARRLQPLLTLRRAARGIPVAVMVIPDEMQVNDQLWEAVRPPGATEQDRLASLALTRRWLEDHGFPTLDLYPLLRAVPPLGDGLRHVYHLRDTHFNARGNRVAGEALAELVAKLLGLPKSAGPESGFSAAHALP